MLDKPTIPSLPGMKTVSVFSIPGLHPRVRAMLVHTEQHVFNEPTPRKPVQTSGTSNHRYENPKVRA
jgi:hypothetical protein